MNDEYSGVDYNRAEERSDSGVTRGSYTVKLPDGRVQTVSYIGQYIDERIRRTDLFLLVSLISPLLCSIVVLSKLISPNIFSAHCEHSTRR